MQGSGCQDDQTGSDHNQAVSTNPADGQYLPTEAGHNDTQLISRASDVANAESSTGLERYGWQRAEGMINGAILDAAFMCEVNEPQTGQRAILIASRTTLVVAFQGTASKSAWLKDLKVRGSHHLP